MMTLQNLLDHSTHRHLELLARAHQIPFTRREAKAKGLADFATALHQGAYRKAFQQLEPAHIEALQALLIAGAWMPLSLFELHFGSIRRYRPWRKDFSPRHPWRYPLSVAERLFHLGFIHIHDQEMVGIVSDYRILKGNPADSEQWQAALEQHIKPVQIVGSLPNLMRTMRLTRASNGSFCPKQGTSLMHDETMNGNLGFVGGDAIMLVSKDALVF